MTIPELLVALFAIVLGVVLIYGTYKQWPAFVDPPKHWSPFYPQALLRKWIGQTGVTAYNCMIGILFIVVACAGLWHKLTQ